MNVTVNLDAELVKAARHAAVDQHTSLSAWVAEQIKRAIENREKEAEEKQKKFLEWRAAVTESFKITGNSGGWKFNREELYDRGEPYDAD